MTNWFFDFMFNSFCSSSFEPEIIKKNCQSSHKMYSNNILNFQESTTILNTHTKKSGNLLNAPRMLSLTPSSFKVSSALYQRFVYLQLTFIFTLWSVGAVKSTWCHVLFFSLINHWLEWMIHLYDNLIVCLLFLAPFRYLFCPVENFCTIF